jgi:hypothetical protein
VLRWQPAFAMPWPQGLMQFSAMRHTREICIQSLTVKCRNGTKRNAFIPLEPPECSTAQARQIDVFCQAQTTGQNRARSTKRSGAATRDLSLLVGSSALMPNV